MRPGQKALTIAVIIFLAIPFFFVAVNVYLYKLSSDIVYRDASLVPAANFAVVLDTKNYYPDQVDKIFEDQLAVAQTLYKLGKVNYILLSTGESGSLDHINYGKNQLLTEGVNVGDIYIDDKSEDFYDNLLRAKKIYQAESIIIVCPSLYMPRTLYLAKRFGIKAYGLGSDFEMYEKMRKPELLEHFYGQPKAILQILFKSEPDYIE